MKKERKEEKKEKAEKKGVFGDERTAVGVRAGTPLFQSIFHKRDTPVTRRKMRILENPICM